MNSSKHDRSCVFGIQIHRLTLDQTVDEMYALIDSATHRCPYVVTPNLDHAVQIQSNTLLQEAYASASLVVADGWPLVAVSRFFRDPLPERVAGSDLVPALLKRIHESGGGKVFLLGAEPGVAEIAAGNIREAWKSVQVAGYYSPPFGFEHDEEENESILRQINACQPDFLVVGFGAPKQELWLKRFHHRLDVGVAIAAGATIDFLAGRQTRAPRWVQRARLEWSHRLLTNPQRLARRYAKNAWLFPGLFLKEHRQRKMNGSCQR